MTAAPYNFRKPGPLSSDLGGRLSRWLQGACALAPDLWGKQLPFRIEMSVTRVEVLRPAEALNQFPDTALGFRLGAAGVTTLLVLPRPLLLALIGGMLGDPGAELPADRELTAVEDSLGDYLIGDLLVQVLRDTWPGADGSTLAVEQREALPKWTRIFPNDQNVVSCALQVQGPFGAQEWYWFLPQPRLPEVFGEAARAGGPKKAGNPMEGVVRELPVPVTVVLGKVEIPLSQLARLRAGDVVILDQRVSDPLTASVSGVPKFRGWPGRVGLQQAFQVDSVVEE